MLGSEGQGIMVIVTTSTALISIFLGGGLQWSNNYFVGKYKDKINSTFYNSIFFAIFVGFLIFVIYLLNIYIFFEKYLNRLFILMIFISVPFFLIQQYNQSILQGIQNFNKYNLINIIKVAILSFLYLILLVIFKLNIKFAVYSWLTTIILVSVISIFLVYKELDNKKINLNINQLIDSLKVGFRALIIMSLGILLFRSDYYLINYFLGVNHVGYYSIAVLIAELLFLTPQIIGQLVFPKAAAQENNLHLLIAKLNRIIIFYSVASAILLMVLGKPLIRVLLGVDFIRSYYILFFLLPGILFVNAGSTIGYYIGGKEGYPSIFIIIMLLAFLINLLLNFFLIPVLGTIGAAISTSIAYIFYISSYFIILGKKNLIPLKDLIFIKFEDFKDIIMIKNFLIIR